MAGEQTTPKHSLHLNGVSFRQVLIEHGLGDPPPPRAARVAWVAGEIWRVVRLGLAMLGAAYLVRLFT